MGYVNRALCVENVNLAVHQAVEDVLRELRKNAHPWPDIPIGFAGGDGYGFDKRLLRVFIARCIDLLRVNPDLAPIKDCIRMPETIPTAKLLAGKVSDLKRSIATDISRRCCK